MKKNTTLWIVVLLAIVGAYLYKKSKNEQANATADLGLLPSETNPTVATIVTNVKGKKVVKPVSASKYVPKVVTVVSSTWFKDENLKLIPTAANALGATRGRWGITTGKTVVSTLGNVYVEVVPDTIAKAGWKNYAALKNRTNVYLAYADIKLT